MESIRSDATMASASSEDTPLCFLVCFLGKGTRRGRWGVFPMEIWVSCQWVCVLELASRRPFDARQPRRASFRTLLYHCHFNRLCHILIPCKYRPRDFDVFPILPGKFVRIAATPTPPLGVRFRDDTSTYNIYIRCLRRMEILALCIALC